MIMRRLSRENAEPNWFIVCIAALPLFPITVI
jgi:hypothetical protein